MVCPVSGILKLIMADMGHFESDQVEIIRAYLYLKLYVLFYSNGPAIWHMTDSRPF